MCRKECRQLSALLRLSPYLAANKRKTIYIFMVKSQLNYCPLVRMFCPRRSNNLNTKAHLQALMTEIYEIINQIAPPVMVMSSLFQIHVNPHNTRHFQVFSNESRRVVNYGYI